MLAIQRQDRFVVGNVIKPVKNLFIIHNAKAATWHHSICFDTKIRYTLAKFVCNVVNDFEMDEYGFKEPSMYPVFELGQSEYVMYYNDDIFNIRRCRVDDDYVCFHDNDYAYRFSVYKNHLIVRNNGRASIVSDNRYALYYAINDRYIKEAIDTNSVELLQNICKLYKDGYLEGTKIYSFVNGRDDYSLEEIYSLVKNEDVVVGVISGEKLEVARFKMALAEISNVEPIKANFKGFVIRYTDNDVVLCYNNCEIASLAKLNAFVRKINKDIDKKVQGILHFTYEYSLQGEWTDEKKMRWARFLKAFDRIEKVG